MSQHPAPGPAPLVRVLPSQRARLVGLCLAGLLVLGCGGDKGGNASGNSGAGGSTSSDRAGSGGSNSGSGGSGGSNSGGGGGSASGGSSSGGGGGSGGGSGAMGGAGGGPAAMGPATLKFCNALSLANMQSIDLTLELGADPLRMVASSGECTPVTKQACTPAKAGQGPVRLLLDGEVIFEGELVVPAAGEHLLVATLDDMTMEPIVDPLSFNPDVIKCADFDFSVLVDVDGGAGDAGDGGGGGMTGPRPPPMFFPAPRSQNIFQSPFRRLKDDPGVMPFGR